MSQGVVVKLYDEKDLFTYNFLILFFFLIYLCMFTYILKLGKP